MIKMHLSKLLGAKRLAQSDLSKMTGIRASTINEIYHEIIVRINVDHLEKICEALNCSVNDLLEYIPSEKPTTGQENLILEEHGHRKPKTK